MMRRYLPMPTFFCLMAFAIPGLSQEPLSPPTPPRVVDQARPAASPALPALPALPAPPKPPEAGAPDARELKRQAREQARAALREAERAAREAARAAEDAERRAEEIEEELDSQEEMDEVDEENVDEEVDGAPRIHVGSGRGDRVVVGNDVHVMAGQETQSAVAVGGSVLMEPGAHVVEDVVAVGGDIHLAPGVTIEGDAVSIGGTIHNAPGAVVKGSRVSLAPSVHILGSLLRDDNEHHVPWSFIAAIASIVRILVLFALATLVVVLVPDRVASMRVFLAERPAVSAMAGFSALAAIIPLCILLVVTLIGIPLAPVAVVCFLLTLVVGFTVVAVWIGERLPLFRNRKTMFVSLALGFVVLTLIDTLLPLVGTIIVSSASLVGAGAVLLSRFGQVRDGAAFVVPKADPPTTALTTLP